MASVRKFGPPYFEVTQEMNADAVAEQCLARLLQPA
jgi:hypothetical protein